MIERLCRYLRGYLIIRFAGKETERFLNLCANRGIRLWKLKYLGGTMYGRVSVRDYKKMHPAFRKTGVRPLIAARRGFPFFLYRNRKRGMWAAGVVLFLFLIFWCSKHIWEVNVTGGYSHTPEQITRFLSEREIGVGSRKKNMDCKGIESMIRASYPDIGWVSAEIRGTVLHIRISEMNLTDTDPVSEGAGNLVAARDGIVRKLVVRRGTPVVSRGDVVKKGDILISGIVPIIGDGDVQIGEKMVEADGDVTLFVTYPYSDRLNREHTVKVYTGRTADGFGLYFGENRLLSYIGNYSYEKYDAAVQEYIPRLAGSFSLPFRLKTISLSEYYEQVQIYTKEECEAILSRRLNAYIKEMKDAGGMVTANEVTITVGPKEASSYGSLSAEAKETAFIPFGEEGVQRESGEEEE